MHLNYKKEQSEEENAIYVIWGLGKTSLALNSFKWENYIHLRRMKLISPSAITDVGYGTPIYR